MNVIRMAVVVAMFALMGTAQAHIQIFTGTLTPEALGATGSGSVTVEYEDEFHTLTITTSFAGLSGLTSVAHIHCCLGTPGSGTVGVAVKAPTLDGFPAGVQSGSYTGTFDLSAAGTMSQTFINANGGSLASAESALVEAMKTRRAYLNIHTTPQFTGGEIRAFLAPVPEPSTVGLMALGIGLLGLAVRRPSPR